MNFSQFFIRRPIFAAVLSLIILIGGPISLFQLPISEYPEVVPPTVVVRATFPGANTKVIGETVAAPLEQAMNGVEHMLYLSSQSTADGKLTLTITFALGTNLDTAQVQVQNRVTRTLPKLPEEVQRLGVTADKASPDLAMVVHLTSPDQRYDMLYLSNYALINVKDELARGLAWARERFERGSIEPAIPPRPNVRRTFQGVLERAKQRRREIGAFLRGLDLGHTESSHMDAHGEASLVSLMKLAAGLENLAEAEEPPQTDATEFHRVFEQLEAATETLIIDVEQTLRRLRDRIKA